MADNLTLFASNNRSVMKNIMNSVGLTNDPLGIEISYFKKWMEDYSLGKDIIKYAFQYAVYVRNTSSFRYIDGILKGWKAGGVTTVKDAMKHTCMPRAAEKKETNTMSDVEKRPEPIRFGDLYVADKKDIIAIQGQPDGNILMYFKGTSETATISGLTMDEMISLLENGTIRPPEPVYLPEDISEDIKTSLQENVRNAFAMISKPWPVIVMDYEGSDKQKSYASSIVEKAVRFLSAKLDIFVKAINSEGNIKDLVTEDGLSVGSLTTVTQDVIKLFNSTKTAAEIIQAKDRLTPGYLSDECRKWMTQNRQ